MNMDTWKQLWLRFIHWPGWTAWLHWTGWKKIAHWQGWTAWLHWPLWKQIAAWRGWKAMLFPHPAIVLVLSVTIFPGLIWLFLTGRETEPLAYALYAGAFYALVTLAALLITAVPKLKRHLDDDPRLQQLKEKEEKAGAFGIDMYFEQFINFFYGAAKIASGIYHGSAWIGADGIYNFAQALIQLYQILRHKQVTSLKQQWKSYRQCGYMMIALHLTMTGLVFQMIHMGRHEESSEIMIIATAAFTFYKLIKTLIEVAKDRKHKNPVDSAAYFLDFSQALYNLFTLQVGLLWVFGEETFAYTKLMNSLTGGAVCLLVCSMGIYMLWRGKRDIRKLEEREIG